MRKLWPAGGGKQEPTTPPAYLPRLHVPLTAIGFSLVRVVQWVLTLVIAASVTVAAWFGWDSRMIAEQAGQYERAAERVQDMNRQFAKHATLAGINLSEERAKALGQKVVFTNQLIEQRTFSWTRFLSDLENAVPPRISISSVALNFKDAVITLNGSALTLKDLTTLVNGLENHAAFRNVVLSQHRIQEPAARDGSQTLGHEGTRTVEFTMTVTYRPPG